MTRFSNPFIYTGAVGGYKQNLAGFCGSCLNFFRGGVRGILAALTRGELSSSSINGSDKST